MRATPFGATAYLAEAASSSWTTVTTARGSLVPSAAAAKAAAAWREMAQVWGSGDGSSQVRSVAATWSAFLDPRGIRNVLRMASRCSEPKGMASAAARERKLRAAGEPANLVHAFRQDC
jgi:hypothetical protein